MGTLIVKPKPFKLLDKFSGADGAYSLRQLSMNYFGLAIRVRRSSDDTELDIGFTSAGDLDTDSLLSFVGAGNGFAVTWYDQSGNNRNATMSTMSKQPAIVTNGVLLTANNRAVINFKSTNEQELITSSATWNSGMSVAVARRTNYNAPLAQVGTGGALNERGVFGRASIAAWHTSYYINGNLWGEQADDFNYERVIRTGFGTKVARTSAMYIGRGDPGYQYSDGGISELILYPVNYFSDRGKIENNINKYYSVY